MDAYEPESTEANEEYPQKETFESLKTKMHVHKNLTVRTSNSFQSLNIGYFKIRP